MSAGASDGKSLALAPTYRASPPSSHCFVSERVPALLEPSAVELCTGPVSDVPLRVRVPKIFSGTPPDLSAK